jgi:hypothetical protein
VRARYENTTNTTATRPEINVVGIVMSRPKLAAFALGLILLLPAAWNGTAVPSQTSDAVAVRQRLDKQQQENAEYLNKFRRLPPEERVRIWKESHNYKYRKEISFRTSDKIQNLLVTEGTDTVPFLARILRDRHEPFLYRFSVITILADMDRYVPPENVPKGAHTLSATAGPDPDTNPFLEITGRRIGAEGREALLWTANQADDKWLQFFARNQLGLVEQELRALPLDEQIRRWRNGVCRHVGGDPESVRTEILREIIVERMPDSLSSLVDALEHDQSSCVRNDVLPLLIRTDLFRMRLRKTEPGRMAIEAVHQALIHGRIKPQCAACQTKDETWTTLTNQFYKDDFGVNLTTPGAYYAQMLHALYGEDTVSVVNVGDIIRQEWPKPEFGAFITFLTDKDPFFPSREFNNQGRMYLEAYHPRFQAKMARIEDAWKQFNAARLADSHKQ